MFVLTLVAVVAVVAVVVVGCYSKQSCQVLDVTDNNNAATTANVAKVVATVCKARLASNLSAYFHSAPALLGLIYICSELCWHATVIDQRISDIYVLYNSS